MTIGKSGIAVGAIYAAILLTAPYHPRLHLYPVRAVQVVADVTFPSQAKEILLQGRAVILDVRGEGDCGTFKIKPCPACVVVRMATDLGTAHTEDEIVMAGELLQERARQHPVLMSALAEQTPIVVMCCKGVRSEITQRVLKSAGFNVTHVPDGMLSRQLPDSLFQGKRPSDAAIEE